MTVSASSTNRWTYFQAAGAAALVIGTNVVPSPTAIQDLRTPYSYVQTASTSPFATTTDNLVAKIGEQPPSRAEPFDVKDRAVE